MEISKDLLEGLVRKAIKEEKENWPLMEGDVYAIVDKFNEKKQDYDQVYFKDNDLNKVKKHLKKMGSKYGKMNLIKVKTNGKMSVVEQMNEALNSSFVKKMEKAVLKGKDVVVYDKKGKKYSMQSAFDDGKGVAVTDYLGSERTYQELPMSKVEKIVIEGLSEAKLKRFKVFVDGEKEPLILTGKNEKDVKKFAHQMMQNNKVKITKVVKEELTESLKGKFVVASIYGDLYTPKAVSEKKALKLMMKIADQYAGDNVFMLGAEHWNTHKFNKKNNMVKEEKLSEGKWAVINANDALNVFAVKVVNTQKEAEKIAKQMKQKDKYGKYQAVDVKRWNQSKPNNKIKEEKLIEAKRIKYKKNDWKKYNKLAKKKDVMIQTAFGDLFKWEDGSNYGVFGSEEDGREIELDHDDIDIVMIEGKLTEIEDHEGSMAKSQLERSMKYSKMIYDMINNVGQGGEVEFPAWVQSKLTKSMDYLQSVFNYLDGKDGIEDKFQTTKLGEDEKKKKRKVLLSKLKNGKLNEKMDRKKAAIILKQIGGNKFIAMTGAKGFAFSDKYMSFKIGKNSKGINFVRIGHNAKDLYDMEFGFVSVRGIKVKNKVKDVYADMLGTMFEKYTGMRTSL